MYQTYVPGISRQKSIRTYVMFRPWTHTSDDSYIYQLSLVVATATESFERSEFLIATSKKKICACVRLILVLVGKKLCVCSTNVGFSIIPGTYYVPDTNVPGISRQKSMRTYVMFQIRMYLVSAGRNLYVRTLCSARGRTRLTTVTSISCRSL